MSNFDLVSRMNTAFNNSKGNAASIDWGRTRKQSLNIIDEWVELMIGLGAPDETLKELAAQAKRVASQPINAPDLNMVRDAVTDIHVFAYGVHHFMGVDANQDMESVIDGVMTRFVKDEADKEATITKHAAAGVTDVYFEGEYPTMIMKSASDQPDAPKGKFLKSASYQDTVFTLVV